MFQSDTVRGAFVTATASSVGISPSAVAITGVSTVAAGRRRLTQATALRVDYQVFVLSASAASSVSGKITSTGGVSVAALQSAGIPVTGVVLTTQPSVAVIPAPPAPPAPSPPPPSPPPPAGCGSSWVCYAGVSCTSDFTCGSCPVGMAGDGRTCAPCSLRVDLTPSFAGNVSARSSDVTLAGVVSALEGDTCNMTGGYKFIWSTNTTTALGAPLALPATPALTLPARTLSAGQTALFSLQACFVGAPTTCGFARQSFFVTASPLVALVGGGGGVVGETPVPLSAAASYDPDGAPFSVLSFAWSCTRVDISVPACAARDGTPVVLGAAPTQQLQLAGATGGALYVITLTVSYGGRQSTTNTTLSVVPGALPLVSIAGSAALSGAKVNPLQQLVLLANATSVVAGGVTTRWSVVAQSGVVGPLLNLSDPAICATPVSSTSMVLQPGALAPGSRYVFQLSAVDSAGAVGLANATLRTSTPPRGGWADVSPATGVALSTDFVLSATGWTADVDELPLTYSCSYMVEGATDPPVSLTGGAFVESPTISMQLPAGLASAGNVITLQLVVRSAFGATALSQASVVVTWPPFKDAAAVSSFVDDATQRAATALQSGDSTAALQVVGGLAALLNSNSSSSQGDAAAADQRSALLAIVASAVIQGGAANIAPAAIESTAVLVSQLVATTTQISDAGALSALAVLGSIAGAGASVSPAAAQAVASALSSVALAPEAAPSGQQSNATSSRFTAVLNVLTSLASSQASSLAVPGQAPVTVQTPTIQMAVGLDDPASSRFNAPLTAPGSNSSFDPLPSDALAAAGGKPVSSIFLSLAFDAHGNATSKNTGGITRLAFSDGATGAPVAVSNLSKPVLFTMPPSILRENEHTTCAWWDDASQAYTSEGCGQLPSPYPAGHELSFIPGFRATGPASLDSAWNITGPRVAGCQMQFLDCSNLTVRATGKLQLGGASTLKCTNLTNSSVLRAFTGATCSLRDTKNSSAPCFWNVTAQTFSGVGCVTSNASRCACTHLTDFTSSPAPNIPTASLADMISLNPADLITKLKLLFIVVVSLFGCLHIGGIVAWVMDSREKAHVAQRLREPACGYRVTDDGTCLWRFGLDPLLEEIAAPTGPAVELSAVFGVPIARLRAALPDEFFATDFGAALGRRHGFSASGMASSRDQHREKLDTSRRLSSGSRTARRSSAGAKLAGADVGLGSESPASILRSPRRSSSGFSGGFSDAVLSPDDIIPGADEFTTAAGIRRQSEVLSWDMDTRMALEEFVGTALVVAFLQVTQLLPVVEIARLRGGAAVYFENLTSPSGWSFDETATAFLTFLSPGVLNTRDKWWVRARLWKLILAQSKQGYWDCTSTVAFALEARSAEELLQVKPGFLERLKDKLAGMGVLGKDLIHSGVHRLSTSGDSESDSPTAHRPTARHSLLRRLSMSASTRFLDESNDDPLWCNPRAISASMPLRLDALRKGDPSEELELDRVWATLCCCAFLQSLNVCWLATDGELYPEVEETIVDTAYGWIDAHAAKHPELAAALEDGALEKAAKHTTTQWHRAWKRRVGELRRAEAFTEHHGTAFTHRASSEMVRALCTKHSTFAVFLSAPLDGMQRWQMWCMLLTVIITQLLVNIWMFYAKGVNCCAEVQALLECPPVGPCRGVEANCGDLPAAFADTPVLPDYPNGLADYTCSAFPNDDNQRDTLIVGLLAFAISLPVTLFLQTCFELANDNEAPESWLSWTGNPRLVFGPQAHRRWRYTGPAGQPVRYVRWFVRSVDAPKFETLMNLWFSLKAWATCSKTPWAEEAEEAEAAAEAANEGSEEASVAADSATVSTSFASAKRLRFSKRKLTAVGIAGVYLIWAFFSWVVFTYGMLIYKLLGPSTQDSFATSFGVSYGVGAAAEWKDIATEAAKTVLILAILERMHVTKSVSWLEDHVDYMSTQALLFQHVGLSMYQQTKLFYTFRTRICDG